MTDDLEVRSVLHERLQKSRVSQQEFLAALVRQPSDNPPGDCAPIAERAAALLATLGLEVESHAVPQPQVAGAGMVSCTNLIVRKRFGPGPTIACNAHGDVVPPGGGWSFDPYGAQEAAGFLYGRGVAVSKSDFATYTYALLALAGAAAATHTELRGAIELHFTFDEETGGTLGPQWLLAQGLTKPDYVLSAGFAHGIVTAHNGCLHLEVVLTGKSAHAARPENGHDALEAAAAVLSDLYAHRQALQATRSKVAGIGAPSLVVGRIEGGTNTNVVPDRVAFRLDRRILPEEDPAAVEQPLTAFIQASAARWPGITATIRQVLLAAPFKAQPGQNRLVTSLQRNARTVMGIDVRPHGVPLYTDARHYAAAGIPTVLYGAGPATLEEARGHAADERLALTDLWSATEVVALTFLDLLTATD